MAGFVYFLPGVSAADAGVLAQRQLSHAFDGNDIEQLPLVQGPGDLGGLLIGHKTPDPKRPDGLAVMRYVSDVQTWRHVEQHDWWLGWRTDAPPGPADLERATMVAGYRVSLADDREWLMPVARAQADREGREFQTTLPCTSGVDFATGEMVYDVKPAYQKLYDRACRYFEWFVSGEDSDPPSDRELFALCVDCLAVNYRLSIWEVSALSLLTRENVLPALQAVIDLPTVNEVAAAQAAAEALTKTEQKKSPVRTPAG